MVEVAQTEYVVIYSHCRDGEGTDLAGSTSGMFATCVVFMLGYPGMGKRTVGGHLAKLIDGVSWTMH